MRYILSSLLLFVFNVVGHGQSRLTIMPERPQAGQQVTIVYHPDGAGATIADTADHIEMMFTYSNFYEMPWKLPMSKIGDHWQASFTIPRYGVRASFYLKSGEQKDQPSENKHYEIVVYDKKGDKVKNSYLYEAYSLTAQSRSAGTGARQEALYEEEIKRYPDNYEAKLRSIAYKLSISNDAEKKALRKKAEEIIADKFAEKPGNMGYMNLTTMGYLIIGENTRLDSIRDVVKKKYPFTEAGYELIIDDLKELPDTAKMVKGLLSLLKNENIKNAEYLKPAHAALFEYYASKRDSLKALYHLKRTGKDNTPYLPQTLKDDAEVLYRNNIMLGKAMELSKQSLALADTFPIGIIRYFPETGYLPSYQDKATREKATLKAKANIYSLMALIKFEQGHKNDGDTLIKTALGLSNDMETLDNAGQYFSLSKEHKKAFDSYYNIAKEHPEDTLDLQKMKIEYISWKRTDTGLDEEMQNLKAYWNGIMKTELINEIKDIKNPGFLDHIVDLEGAPVSPDLLKNKIAVLDLWATWCVPCMNEMPYLQKAYEHFKNDTNVVFMVINSGAKNTLANARAWWGNKAFSFPVYYNTDPDIGDKLKFDVIPATFVIDTNDHIRFKTIGFEGPVIERKIPAAIELLRALKP